MRKLTTKLLMSIIAVAFAFVALGTSTYAWFAMNSTVKTEGMTFTAKADQTFLLISDKNNTADEIRAENGGKGFTTASTAYTAKGRPAMLKAEVVLDADTVAAASSWQYAYSNDVKNANTEANEFKSISEDDLTKHYVGIKTVYVCVAKDVIDAEDLYISNVNVPENTGISVVIAAATDKNGNNKAFLHKADYTYSTTEEKEILAPTISSKDGTVVTVKCYIFVDGQNANVYSDNLTKLIGNITFDLSCTSKVEAN